MEKKLERHKYNAKISSVHFQLEKETQTIHISLFFKDGLLALDGRMSLVNKLGNEFGLTVIENENGVRVSLEFANNDNLLYTDLVIQYKKSELEAIVISEQYKIYLHFYFIENGLQESIKSEPLSFLKRVKKTKQ